MNILIAVQSVLIWLLAVTQTSAVELTQVTCAAPTTKLTGSSGTIEIKPTSPKSCNWTLSFDVGSRVNIKSKLLCLDCADKLWFTDSTGNNVWDVETVHQLQSGNPSSGKVCSLPNLYCSNASAKRLYVTQSPLTLMYERHGTGTLSIIFNYDIYTGTSPAAAKPGSGATTKKPSSGTTSSAQNMTSCILLVSFMLISLLY